MYSSTDSERVNGNSNGNFSVYKSLNHYNRVTPGDVNGPAIPQRIPSMAVQVVPQYHNQMRYHALTHNVAPEQMNVGHYTVRNAYPNYLAQCDTFTPRDCKGMVVDQENEATSGMTGATGLEVLVEVENGLTGMNVPENYEYYCH